MNDDAVFYAAIGDDGIIRWVGHVSERIWPEVMTQWGHLRISKEEHDTIKGAQNPFRHADGLFFEVPPPKPPRTEAQVRAERDRRLAASDWMQLGDVPASAELKAARLTYRQALRDVPSQPGFPAKVSWPKQP